MLEEMLKNVREKSPLIHNITNYVTVNDCANVVLACGASPIMADDQKEVAEITSICTGLNINIGTLNTRTIESMVIAGKKANELHHPVVLDPVGVGASTLRTQTALKLLKERGIETTSTTHIISIIIGDNERIGKIGQNMKERGYLLYPVKEPTVPKGTARFRIGLNPYITYEEIEKFVEELKYEIDTIF